MGLINQLFFYSLICLCWKTTCFLLIYKTSLLELDHLQALIQIDFIMGALWDNRNNFKTKQMQANEKRGTCILQVDSALNCPSFTLDHKSVMNGNWKVKMSVSFSHIGYFQNLYVKIERHITLCDHTKIYLSL